MPTRPKLRPRSPLYCLERGCAYSPRTRRPTLNQTGEVAAFLHNFFPDPCPREVFVALLLDSRNRLLRAEIVSIGTLTVSIVHPREVFASAIVRRAVSIIVCHNHPSGDPSPSIDDVKLTKRLIKAGELLGINVLDHIILGNRIHHSMKVHGDPFR